MTAQRQIENRVQLTTDGLKAYLEAVEGAFGAEIDFAQLVKVYGTAPDAEKRFLQRKSFKLTNCR